MSEKQDMYISRIQEKATINKRIYLLKDTTNNVLQFIIIVGAASVPILLIISSVPKPIPIITSGIVAVTAALSNYYKFGECCRIHRATFEALTKEIDMNNYQVGPYRNLEEDQAFYLFVERIELVLDEHSKKLFALQVAQYQQIEIPKSS